MNWTLIILNWTVSLRCLEMTFVGIWRFVMKLLSIILLMAFNRCCPGRSTVSSGGKIKYRFCPVRFILGTVSWYKKKQCWPIGGAALPDKKRGNVNYIFTNSDKNVASHTSVCLHAIWIIHTTFPTHWISTDRLVSFLSAVQPNSQSCTVARANK